MNELLQLMLNRRSVRKYTGEPIPEGKLKLILQAGLASATSKNRKPWEFVVVQEKETLQTLAKCRMGAAKMLENAGCAIVVFANTEVTPDVWAEDCSIAMSNMHLMADALGLGSCWIQGSRQWADDRRILPEAAWGSGKLCFGSNSVHRCTGGASAGLCGGGFKGREDSLGEILSGGTYL